MNTPNLIQKAEFSPRIKTYILLLGFFFLLITFIGIPLAIIWFLGVGQYYSKRYYENLHCRLTDRHLQFAKGVLFKVEKTIPLENIQDLTFIQNPILNMLDLRILKVETAGHSNTKGSDMTLIGIVGAEAFKDLVLDQREEMRSEQRRNSQKSESSSDQMISLLTEIRDLLKSKN